MNQQYSLASYYFPNSLCSEPKPPFQNYVKNCDFTSLEDELFCHEVPLSKTVSTPSDGSHYDQTLTEPSETMERDCKQKQYSLSDLILLQSGPSCGANIETALKSTDENKTLENNFLDHSVTNEDFPKENLKLTGPKWSEDQDKCLLKLAAEMKYDWKSIADKFGDRRISPEFVKMRYQKLVETKFQPRTKFHPIEDLMIAKYFEKYGSNWTRMATHFQNRTPIMLKNRYYSFIRKRNLLGFLIQKVKEFENPNPEDGHASKLQQPMDYNRLNQECPLNFIDYSLNSEDDKCSVVCFDQSTDENSGPKTPSRENEVLKRVEKVSKSNGVEDEAEKKEISVLKEQVNTLKSLLLQMKFEIDQLKDKIENQSCLCQKE